MLLGRRVLPILFSPRVLLLAFLLGAVSPRWVDAAPMEPFVGMVTRCEGATVLVRSGQRVPVVVGTRIAMGDTLRTPAGGVAGVVFADDTLVSLGPLSEVTVDEYVFDPAGGRLAFVARIVRGTVAYVSGQIAKLAPSAVRIVAPTATIATRGTYVLIRVP